MHRHHHHRDLAPPPRLRLGQLVARIALGGTIAIAVLGAGAFVFGPFSDLSAPPPAGGAGPKERKATTASAPIAHLAPRDARDL
jgi:hypothetical protein